MSSSPHVLPVVSLTQENGALAVEDHNNAILELGGEVEGEARPWQTWMRWWDLLQHIVHDVLAVIHMVSSQTVSQRAADD